jgi:hypothetical protein
VLVLAALCLLAVAGAGAGAGFRLVPAAFTKGYQLQPLSASGWVITGSGVPPLPQEAVTVREGGCLGAPRESHPSPHDQTCLPARYVSCDVSHALALGWAVVLCVQVPSQTTVTATQPVPGFQSVTLQALYM